MIFAIDPGPVESAWVVLAGDRLMAFRKDVNADALAAIRAREEGISTLVIEQIACYGMAVGAEVFETCVWTGRFMEAFGADHVTRIKRLEVKMHLCHDSRAKDQNIRAALIDRFGGPDSIRKGGKLYRVSGDCWAALAVGITYADKYELVSSE